MRTPLAYQFDRNCALAATAGQIVAAAYLNCEIAAVVVGTSPFDVGFVAIDIRLSNPPQADARHAAIAAAAALALGWAAGLTTQEAMAGLEDAPLLVMQAAEAILTPLLIDGRLAALVRRLDALSLPGEWTELSGLMELAAQ